MEKFGLDHSRNDNVAVDFVKFPLLRREQRIVHGVAKLAMGNGCSLFERLQNLILYIGSKNSIFNKMVKITS